MELINKEVLFNVYCEKCKHKKVIETEDPCNECLTQNYNEHSRKPIKFEASDERKD